MGILDMFDKLDDIIYEPVKAVSNWIGEPLKKWEHNRELEKMQTAAEIEETNAKRNMEIQQEQKRLEAELEADQRRWNAEIDQLIAEQEDRRRDKIIASIKQYQIDLANTSKDIINSIGLMSLDLREKANKLVLEKTNEYIAIQKTAQDDAEKRLDNIETKYADNERLRIRMEDSVIDNMEAIINHANQFISELSEDLKRLNENTDELVKISTTTILTTTNSLGNNLTFSGQNSTVLPIEEKTIDVALP